MTGLPLLPAGIGVVDVQVTICALAPHVQPVPVADAYANCAGNVSTSVSVPKVAAVPGLLGVRVYTPAAARC